MERRESKTPASDMWHVLNINRRVEAAEAAIQGMTNLIDTINSEVDELKNNNNSNNNTIENSGNEQNNNPPEPVKSGSISKQEQDISKMAAKLKSYDGKFTDIEKKLGNVAMKDEIFDLCTEDQVKELIKENLDNFEPSFPMAELTTKAETGIEEVMVDENTRKTEPNSITEPVVEKVVTVPSKEVLQQKKSSIREVKHPKTSTGSLKKRDSRESRTRIAYQEVSGKMLYLEQEIIKAKEKVEQVEEELGKKLELSEIEGKVDKTEVASYIDGLRDEIKVLNEQVATLEKSYKVVSEDVSSLMSQNDEFTVQQKMLSKSMRKLERNLEDITDNFHRSQSDIVRKASLQTNMVDEAAITKIRGTIFDVQEQQSKFQSQIDSLLQDSKNKGKAIEDVNTEIRSMEERKVDKAFVKKELECKVDKSAIANKLNRDQFNACIEEIDRNIQAVIQKSEGTEAYLQMSMKELQGLIQGKMDRTEVKQIHAYIDSRFKSFKPKVKETRISEETAAASRKQLLKNCNCISCDRPVDIPISNDGITLPCYQALPGVKSIRPVNTFDLQTIRQHMQQTWMTSNNKYRFELAQERDKLQKELLQLCGVRDLEELAAATNRACGGEHTLIEQHRRNPTKPPMLYREENTPFRQSDRQLLETEVRGRDGHIYRGRMQSPVLPTLQRKDTSSNEKPTSPPPRVGSPIRTYPSSVEPQQSGNNFVQHKVVTATE